MYPHDASDEQLRGFLRFGHRQRGKKVRKDAKSSPTAQTKDTGAWQPEVFAVHPGALQPAAASLPLPFQKNKTVLSTEPTLEPPLPAQTGYEVEINGLSPHLMSQPMMEAILEQAQLGLEKVLGFKFIGQGQARIALSSLDAAETCAAHFNGRNWNRQGHNVTAQVLQQKMACSPTHMPKGPLQHNASTQRQSPMSTPATGNHNMGGQSSLKASREAAFAGYGLPWLPAEAPAYIHCADAKDSGFIRARGRVGTSDASTTVSDEDHRDHDQWWAGELNWSNSGQTKASL